MCVCLTMTVSDTRGRSYLSGQGFEGVTGVGTRAQVESLYHEKFNSETSLINHINVIEILKEGIMG